MHAQYIYSFSSSDQYDITWNSLMASNKGRKNEEIKVLHLKIFSIIWTLEKLKPPLKIRMLSSNFKWFRCPVILKLQMFFPLNLKTLNFQKFQIIQSYFTKFQNNFKYSIKLANKNSIQVFLPNFKNLKVKRPECKQRDILGSSKE